MHKLVTSKLAVLTLTVGAALSTSLPTHAAGGALQSSKSTPCLWSEVVTTGGKSVCSYDISVAFVNHRTKVDLLTATTDIVGHVFDIVTGDMFDITGSLRNEVKPNMVIMKPTKGHENYLRCGHSHLVASINDARVFEPTITSSEGAWRWSLERQMVFEGRNWYMGHWAWVSHHPSIKPNVKRCSEQAESAVERMEGERQRKEAAEQARLKDRKSQSQENRNPISFPEYIPPR